MGLIYTMERHHEVLFQWREDNATSLQVVHLDFHCDMRGMLVDRVAQRAHRIRDRFHELDQGNFLAHAVLEHRIDRLRWVHDVPGGRADDIGTVKLESDLTALPHRLMLARRGDEGIPLAYDIVTSADWQGLRDGDVLDIDWDYFACTEYPVESIPARVDAFWNSIGDVVPELTYICYSPEYSHPSRQLFGDFVVQLADRFGSSVVEREQPADHAESNRRSGRGLVPDSVYELGRSVYRSASKALKHRGVF
jgi:hypothetical protein